MISAPRSAPHLDVGQALRDGWRAFGQAPWLFVGFALLLTALQLTLQLLQPATPADQVRTLDPNALAATWQSVLAWRNQHLGSYVALILNLLVGTLLNLWGSCGMVRSAWVALGGDRPRLSSFTRWDPGALWRLYVPGFLLGCALLAALFVLVLAGVALSLVNPLLMVVPGLILVVGSLYVMVSQAFLTQVALLHDRDPFAALARGPAVVAPAWVQVLKLGLLNAGLTLLGLLACGIGLVVVWPLVVCVGTAGYRQLFGPEDRTGFSRDQTAPMA